MKFEEPMTPTESADNSTTCSPKTPEKTKSDEEQKQWTPTSNFKVLLKALSPEMKKERAMEDSLSSMTPCDLFNEEVRTKVHVGRKEKSLEVLCQRLLVFFYFGDCAIL